MDADPRAVALLERAEPGVELEVIEGELFASAPPTEYLAAVIERAADELRRGLEGVRETRVLSQELVALGPRTIVRPDAIALDAESGVPIVAVEVRTESTDRYALGPKRMAYARARVPEYWFVDPRARRVVVLRLEDGEPDYRWPAEELGAGETIVSIAHPGLTATIDELLLPRGHRVDEQVAEAATEALDRDT